ncbi:MAG TPA: hypothetical protein PK887_02135 [Ignavibacteriales bacterium]|nr:hypothetical protein [Ignavibacteriales bacterium]
MKKNIINIIFFVLLLQCSAFAQFEILKSYYDNGNLKAEISYVNNVRDGYTKLYFENGQIAEEAFFEKGVLSGFYYSYYLNGQIKTSAYYKDGVLNGVKINYDSLGNIIDYFVFEDGEIKNSIVVTDTTRIEKYKKREFPRNYLKFLQKQANKEYLEYNKIPEFENKIPNILKNYRIIDNVILSDKIIAIKDPQFLKILYGYVEYPTIIKDYKLDGISWIKVTLTPEGKLLKSEVIYYLGFGCDYLALSVVDEIKEYWDEIFQLNEITNIAIPIYFKK